MEKKYPESRLPAFLQNRIGETAVGAALGAIYAEMAGSAYRFLIEPYTPHPEHLQDFPLYTAPAVGAVAVGYGFYKAGAFSRNRQNGSEI